MIRQTISGLSDWPSYTQFKMNYKPKNTKPGLPNSEENDDEDEDDEDDAAIAFVVALKENFSQEQFIKILQILEYFAMDNTDIDRLLLSLAHNRNG